jgi:hypothetical protein
MQEGASMTNFIKKLKEIKTNMAIVGEVLINDKIKSMKTVSKHNSFPPPTNHTLAPQTH